MFALGVFASSAFAQQVVMSHLDNPRGLAFAPTARSTSPRRAGRCWTLHYQSTTREVRCFGRSGAITRLWKGRQERVVEGLESHAMPDGSSASGPTDISFQGTGGAYITMGLGGDADFQADLGGTYSGTLLHMAASGKWRVVADILEHEEDENLAEGRGHQPVRRPRRAGGRIVVDAGGNSLLRVAANGTVETLAVFPSQPNPAFPSSPPLPPFPPRSSRANLVARGPDGALYVGELTGYPFVQGLARISASFPDRTRGGLHRIQAIIDIAFAPDGSLLVVENATGGFFFLLARQAVAPESLRCSRTPLLTALIRRPRRGRPRRRDLRDEQRCYGRRRSGPQGQRALIRSEKGSRRPLGRRHRTSPDAYLRALARQARRPRNRQRTTTN